MKNSFYAGFQDRASHKLADIIPEKKTDFFTKNKNGREAILGLSRLDFYQQSRVELSTAALKAPFILTVD